MPRIESQSHANGYPSFHTVVRANVLHSVRSPLDALIALLPQNDVGPQHPPSSSRLQRDDAARLLEAAWEHSVNPEIGRSIHFTCDGICIDIMAHPSGLEFTDCASGETRLLYGCDLDGLIQAAAANVLGVAAPNDMPGQLFPESHDVTLAGNLPRELWEEIALHLRDYDDLAALLSASRQFGPNLGARTRILQLRALWTFRQREIAPLTVLKAVLVLIKPWPSRGRVGVLYAVTRFCKAFSRDPDLLNFLAGEAIDLPDWGRLRVYKELVGAAHVCESDALWRRCAAAIRGVCSAHPYDRASALIALATSFGKLDTAIPRTQQEDFDELFGDACTLPAGHQREMVVALAGGAARLAKPSCREAAWARCAAKVSELNHKVPAGSGEALVALASTIDLLETKEARGRAWLALVLQFERLDPSDSCWTTLLILIDSEFPRAYHPATLGTLTSVVIRLKSDHPYKAWALQVVLGGLTLARRGELNSESEIAALLSLVHAVSALTKEAPDWQCAVLQVLSSIPDLPVELRTRVWEAIYRAVPQTIDTAVGHLQAQLRVSLDLAIASLPDRQQAETLPREPKRPRRGEEGG